MTHQPRHPSGTVPGKDFSDAHETYSTTKLGRIFYVDEINMKANIALVGGGERLEIDLTQGLCGPRSFWGGVPEVNSVVIIGYRRKHKQLHEAVILGYIPVGNKTGMRFDPFSQADPSDVTEDEKDEFEDLYGSPVRYKRLKLRPGDVGGMSASGAEFALTKDVRMCDRAGDLVELRDTDRSLIQQSIHRVDSQAGVYHVSGPARRGSLDLPEDILQSDGKTLHTKSDNYYGRDELQGMGPDTGPLANSDGVINDRVNNETDFPALTLSNGRIVRATGSMVKFMNCL